MGRTAETWARRSRAGATASHSRDFGCSAIPSSTFQRPFSQSRVFSSALASTKLYCLSLCTVSATIAEQRAFAPPSSNRRASSTSLHRRSEVSATSTPSKRRAHKFDARPAILDLCYILGKPHFATFATFLPSGPPPNPRVELLPQELVWDGGSSELVH